VIQGEIAFIVTHPAPADRVARYVLNLLQALRVPHSKLFFVANGLDVIQKNELLERGDIVVDRHGDTRTLNFYRAGLDALGDISRFQRLVLLDCSFIAFNIDRFLAKVMTPAEHLDLASITTVHYPAPRVNTSWLAFEGPALLGSAAFRQFWEKVDKQVDLNMAQHFINAGFRVGSLFEADRDDKIVAVSRSLTCGAMKLDVPHVGPYRLDPNWAFALEPMTFLWDKILENFGVASIDLMIRNPHGVNVYSLLNWLANFPDGASLFNEVAARRGQ
jgi:hypothetical protein